MSRRVRRWTIGDSEWHIHVPQNAKFLHVAALGGDAAIWLEVDTSEPIEIRHFNTVGTSDDIPEGTEYRGTARFYSRAEGPSELHVYERLEVPS